MRKNWRVHSEVPQNEYAITRAFSSYQLGLLSLDAYCKCVSYLLHL